jgi:hypothetical protein
MEKVAEWFANPDHQKPDWKAERNVPVPKPERGNQGRSIVTLDKT